MNNNIRKFYLFSKLAFLFLLIAIGVESVAQNNSYNRPDVTNKMKEFKHQVKLDSNKRMIELKSLIPDLIYDLRYASINNFMNRLMYPAKTTFTFLRLNTAIALHKVQQELKTKGLSLKIFDAYRPYSVTVKFWELVKDERFVANPANGSGHNRGTTVDLTIIKSTTGKELNMGTGFDNFSDTAHHNFSNLPEEVLQNRLLLKSVMSKFGFKPYNDEWWHYSFTDSIKYEILDLDFKKLKKEL